MYHRLAWSELSGFWITKVIVLKAWGKPGRSEKERSRVLSDVSAFWDGLALCPSLNCQCVVKVLLSQLGYSHGCTHAVSMILSVSLLSKFALPGRSCRYAILSTPTMFTVHLKQVYTLWRVCVRKEVGTFSPGVDQWTGSIGLLHVYKRCTVSLKLALAQPFSKSLHDPLWSIISVDIWSFVKHYSNRFKPKTLVERKNHINRGYKVYQR